MERLFSRLKTFTNKGCKIAVQKKVFFLRANVARIRRLYNKDQEIYNKENHVFLKKTFFFGRKGGNSFWENKAHIYITKYVLIEIFKNSDWIGGGGGKGG